MRRKKETRLMKAAQTETTEVVEYGPGVSESLTDLGHHAIDGAVSMASIAGNTINNIVGACESVQLAEYAAGVEVARIESEFHSKVHEEGNVHMEVMENISNVSKVVDTVISSPELKNNPDVMISLLDAIGNNAKQSVEIRKGRKGSSEKKLLK